MSCVRDAWAAAALPSLYNFDDGTSGTSISDGGRDMYDGGNTLRVQSASLTSPGLAYNQLCTDVGAAEGASTGVGDVRYSTCRIDDASGPGPVFAAAFSSVSAQLEGVMISGNLGCDGSGTTRASVRRGIVSVQGGAPVYGWWKSVFCSDDPSVNHLVISSDAGSHTYSPDTDNDMHSVAFDGLRAGAAVYLM
jgi:hypothetical protein